jgi:8-oxo-dGTP pyrophosphatase MutT (NUDIX family)
MIESAGLLIIYNNKILLAHPVKKKLRYGTYTIPKGKLQVGETHLQAAIRETKEETGVIIDENIIDKTPHIINYTDEEGNIYKRLTYFIVYLEKKIKITKKKYDKKEIDWVGFIDKNEGMMRIFWRFEEMLYYLK